MTQDEIIEMARQVGIIFHGLGNTPEELEAFAKLVAAKEREACARIVESVNSYDNPMTSGDCSEAIRARGEQA